MGHFECEILQASFLGKPKNFETAACCEEFLIK